MFLWYADSTIRLEPMRRVNLPIRPSRRDGRGRGWSRPRGPTCSAFTRWQVSQVQAYSAGLPRSEGEPAHQGRRLVPANVASERAVVALLENAMLQVAAIGDAEPVCFALTAPKEQTTPDQERASRWSSCGWGHR